MENNFQNIRQSNKEKLIKAISVLPIGILTFDSDWKINFVNDVIIKIGTLYHFDFSSLAGSNLYNIELFPDSSIQNELNDLKAGYSFEKEIKSIKTIDGGRISVLIKASPLFEEGKFEGGILIIEDIKIPNVQKEKSLITEYLVNILSNINDFLFITDKEGNVKYSLGKNLRRLSFLRTDLTNLHVSKIFFDAFGENISRLISSISEKKVSEKLILSSNVDGKYLYYECRIEPMLNAEGEIQFIFFWFTDVTGFFEKSKRLSAEIDELTQYQVITDSVTDSVFALDMEGKIIFWNKASENLFGFTKSQVFGKLFYTILSSFDINIFNKIKNELNVSSPYQEKFNVLDREGKIETIEAKFYLTNTEKNNIVVLCRNITEELKEEKLESTFSEVVRQSTEMICTISSDGKIIFANKEFLNKLKFSEDEITGINLRRIIDQDYLKENNLKLDLSSLNQNKKIELLLRANDGAAFLFQTEFVPIFHDNRLNFIICYFHDITEQKKIQNELNMFRSIIDAARDGIALEQKGVLIHLNDSFTKIFGYNDSSELIGKEMLDLVSYEDVPKVSEYFKRSLENYISQKNRLDFPNRFEFIGKRKDGMKLYASVSISPFSLNKDKQTYNVITARDITEIKRSQQAIQESEERYRNIADNIDDFLYTFERVRKILRPVFCTSAVEKITGYNQSELLKDSKLFLKIVHPDDLPYVKKRLRDFTLSRIQQSDQFEFRLINRYGNVVWVRNKFSVVRKNNGVIQKTYGMVSDISLNKKAEEELKKSKENLVKLNETKDRFISIISHDLRTPFSSILGFTDLLLNDEELTEEEKKQYVRFIQESSGSMLALVNSLLDWTRLQTGRIQFEPEKIEAYTIVEKSLHALSGAAFQKNIELISTINKELNIFVDKNLIGQVFNNLISNAIKFTRDLGKIVISASPSSKTRFFEFSVKDNGVGIKPENLKKLFSIDTKFSSEGTAGEKGTGLGLSLVKEIIEKHGGTIQAESEPGKGSEFIFTLPVASADILLVDDSKTDRLLYSKILKSITPDYNVETASDGKEALERVKQTPPALIITDHIMPEMNGYELVQELEKLNIKMKPPIIILSSDIDRAAIHDYNLLGIEYVFQKPVNLSTFKQAVEKSLRQGLEL